MAPLEEQCNGSNCSLHYHDDESTLLSTDDGQASDVAKPDVKPPTTTSTVPQQLHGFRRIVKNFTPSWFIITMSTGAVAIVLHQIPEPYDARWLRILSDLFFVLNIFLFILFTFISIVRYILYPEILHTVIRHPHQSLFLACFPVGLSTIVNMIVLVCVPAWGHGWATFAWVLWWIVLVLALGTCFHLSFTIMSHRRHDLEEMTALYLIPIVAVVIVSASGALLAGALPNTNDRLWTLIISYILWGLGAPLSWMIMTIYLHRLLIHKPLKREVIVSLLLPIGPLGIEGFSIISLSKVSQTLLPKAHAFPLSTPEAGNIINVISGLLGLLLWGFALIWLGVAVTMLLVSGGFPFNMGWWGFIFPVGVYTLLTIALSEFIASKFLKIVSCILAACLVATWLVVAAGTIWRSITGEMFYAPCLGTDLYSKGGTRKQKVGVQSTEEAATTTIAEDQAKEVV